MQKLKTISGAECIKILCNKFDFKIIRQKGSHIILKKETDLTGCITIYEPPFKREGIIPNNLYFIAILVLLFAVALAPSRTKLE